MMIFVLTASKGSSTFEFILQQGEYFQSTRILIKHWWYKHNNYKRKTTESESEKLQTEAQQSKYWILAFPATNAKVQGFLPSVPHAH